MTKKLTIDAVTRIEGHAKITIHLDDAGNVSDAQFHVTQVRGFEKFVEGRPYYEMPGITARICGICPVSHLVASAKACDAIMAVAVPETAAKLREVVHLGQIVQSHALSFFHLSGPDLFLGMESDPAKRNVFGLAELQPERARDGIALRKFGQRIIERLAGERIHPSWFVPGGVSAPLSAEARDGILAELPEAKRIARRAIDWFKGALDEFEQEIRSFGTQPTLYAGLVDARGRLQLYDGRLRFLEADGTIAADQVPPEEYLWWMAETVLPFSYLKAPYVRPKGIQDGVYRVGPLARLNVADACGTPEADAELREFRERCGRPARSSFLYHYARLVELVHALEKLERLLQDRAILGKRVRARAEVNSLEGVGIAEAPRGTLIHHYKVDENGAMRWANLIIATGHNNLAINRAILEVSRRYVDGNRVTDGMINRVQAIVRAFDPCLSCSTHALGVPALRIELLGADGKVLDTVEG